VVEKYQPVDLQSKANQKLTDNLGTGAEGNNSRSCRPALRTSVASSSPLAKASSNLAARFRQDARQVEGIKLGKSFAKLHISMRPASAAAEQTGRRPWS